MIAFHATVLPSLLDKTLHIVFTEKGDSDQQDMKGKLICYTVGKNTTTLYIQEDHLDKDRYGPTAFCIEDQDIVAVTVHGDLYG